MPKIRQALAVLAAAASCIAFNTYRYPVVREMVAAASLPSQTEDTKAAGKPSPLEASRTRDALAASESLKVRDRVVCKDGVCSMPLPDAPTASLNSASKSDALGRGSLQDETDGPGRWESKSGSTDRSASAPPEAETARKPKGTSKKASSQTATPSSNSKGNSLKEGESKVAKTRSTEPSDTSSRAESWPTALDDARSSDQAPSDFAAELAAKGPAPSYDPYAGPTYETSDEKSGTDGLVSDRLSRESRPSTSRDRSLSTSGGGAGGFFNRAEQSVKDAPLVPIVRPASRIQRSETAAAKAMVGFQLAGQRGTQSEGVRQLPPVGSDFPTEPPYLNPDLVSTYPVTSAE